MPYFCVTKVTRALNSHGKSLQGSRALVMGVAYKADIDDLRESPALKMIRQLGRHGMAVDYHDPFVTELPQFDMRSVDLTEGAGISAYDVVIVVTAHTTIDYADVVDKRAARGRSSATPPPVSTVATRSGSFEAAAAGRASARMVTCREC